MSDNKKICIIGAGASGLAAAISASRAGAQVCVLEHKDSAAIKLSITGNGKCNFTNMNMDTSCYHEENVSCISNLLNRFKPSDTIEFMSSLGIRSTDKFGYIYPENADAKDVAKKLIDNVGEIRYGVSDIDIDDIRRKFDSVIIACGSRSYKKTGSDGSGYKFLEKLGIKYTRILPALCPILIDTTELLKDYPQKRLFAKISVFINNENIASDCGEIQIKDNGISGIPVMNVSRYVSKGIDSDKKVSIIVDSDIKAIDLPLIIRSRFNSITNNTKTYKFICNKIAEFDKAQVCTGGVPFEALDENFMLKDVPGVYVIGEMIDVDGICGGYNLHFAFASGYIAGKAAAL